MLAHRHEVQSQPAALVIGALGFQSEACCVSLVWKVFLLQQGVNCTCAWQKSLSASFCCPQALHTFFAICVHLPQLSLASCGQAQLKADIACMKLRQCVNLLCRRPSAKSLAQSSIRDTTEKAGPPTLMLPTKSSRPPTEPSTPSKGLARTVTQPDAGKGYQTLAIAEEEQLQEILAHSDNQSDLDFMQSTLGAAATSPKTSPRAGALRQTLVRGNTVSPGDFLRQTLARTSTAMGSGFFGRTLGRAGTGMGSMAFGNTLSRTGAASQFALTQSVVPPLLIDPLVTSMLQKAEAPVIAPQSRSASPAFIVRTHKPWPALVCTGSYCDA